MSRRIVGYDGEGRRRRPIYSDEGPAAAGAVSGLEAIGRLSALQIRQTAGAIEFGAGQVERRQITADEDAARRELDDRPSPIAPVRPAMGSREHLQQSRMRGAVRHQEVMAERVLAVVTGPTVSARTLEEEPAMAVEDSPETDPFHGSDPLGADLAIALAALRDAVAEAVEAHVDFRNAEARWDAARDAVVACYRDTGLLAIQGDFPVGLRDRDLVQAVDVDPRPLEELVRVAEQRHEQLLNGDAGESKEPPSIPKIIPEPTDGAPPSVGRPAAGGGPGRPLGRQQRQILEAIVEAKGDRRATADRVGLSITAVLSALHGLGRTGRLPAELIPLLPAGFAKYRPAGL